MLERETGREREKYPVLSAAPRSRSFQGRMYRRAHKRQMQTAEDTVGLSNIGGDMKWGMISSTDESNYPSKSEAFIQSNFLMEDALGSLGMIVLWETTACS